MRRKLRLVRDVYLKIWNHPANRGLRLRKLAKATVFQLKGRILRKPSIASLGNHSRLWVPLHSYSASKALYANPPDWPEMIVWARHLRKGDLFVDVGANIGIYTIWAKEKGADVIAIEPDEVAVRQLNENLRLNNYRVDVRNVALASKPGSMKITTGLGVSNRLLADGGSKIAAGRDVEVSTLDDLLGDRFAAGVKVDVEGAELLVLEGGQRALAERRISLLQLEWNACSQEFFGVERWRVGEFLLTRGYELCRPTPEGNLVVVKKPELGPDVFARPSSGFRSQ